VLKDFWAVYPQAQGPLPAWHQLTTQASWKSFAELRATFSTADVAGRLTIFNLGGNKFRLIARVEYRLGIVFIRRVLTHGEYSKNKWKDDPWF